MAKVLSYKKGGRCVMSKEAKGKVVIKVEVKIPVIYELVDDAHFFTASSLGLCVAHTDLKTAFDEVGTLLDKLLKLNLQSAVIAIKEINPGVTFAEFKKWVTAANSSPSPNLRPRPRVELMWLERDMPRQAMASAGCG